MPSAGASWALPLWDFTRAASRGAAFLSATASRRSSSWAGHRRTGRPTMARRAVRQPLLDAVERGREPLVQVHQVLLRVAVALHQGRAALERLGQLGMVEPGAGHLGPERPHLPGEAT